MPEGLYMLLDFIEINEYIIRDLVREAFLNTREVSILFRAFLFLNITLHLGRGVYNDLLIF